MLKAAVRVVPSLFVGLVSFATLVGCSAESPTTTAEEATDATPADSSASDDADAVTPEDQGTPVLDEGPPPPDPGSPPDEGPPPITGPTLSTFIGDWTMKPGQESTRCVEKRLGNVDPVIITGISTKLWKGSHHLIVYKSSATQEQTEPFECEPFSNTLSGSAPLIISEIAQETLQYPPGVGFELEADQMVRIEAHYLNYHPEEITAHADITFHLAEEGEIEHLANMMLYGTTSIFLAPGSQWTTPWHYLDVLNGSKVFAVTGHTHRFGTNVEVEQASGESGDGTAIYPGEGGFDWAEAPVITYDPPLEFGPGQGFRFRCSWNNTSSNVVQFGLSASDEMCFLWAYYYPSKGFQLCTKGLSIGGCKKDN